jgi:hypothetical protein
VTDRTRRLVAATALATTLVAGAAAGPAVAAPPTTSRQRQAAGIAYLKQRGNIEIDRRLGALTTLRGVVTDATHLTDADRRSLLTTIDDDTTGLTALKAKIDNDTDLATARADVKSIVTAYRVYVLLEPKVHLVRAADASSALGDAFGTLATKLQTRIDAAKQAGKDVTAAQAALDDLQAKVADATGKAAPIPGQVVPLTPAGYPGNRPTLVAARGTMLLVKADYEAARTDAKNVVNALR